MNSLVWPSWQRLANALDIAAKITRQISRIIKQAENDAAVLFKILGGTDGQL